MAVGHGQGGHIAGGLAMLLCCVLGLITVGTLTLGKTLFSLLSFCIFYFTLYFFLLFSWTLSLNTSRSPSFQLLTCVSENCSTLFLAGEENGGYVTFIKTEGQFLNSRGFLGPLDPCLGHPLHVAN